VEVFGRKLDLVGTFGRSNEKMRAFFKKSGKTKINKIQFVKVVLLLLNKLFGNLS